MLCVSFVFTLLSFFKICPVFAQFSRLTLLCFLFGWCALSCLVLLSLALFLFRFCFAFCFRFSPCFCSTLSLYYALLFVCLLCFAVLCFGFASLYFAFHLAAMLYFVVFCLAFAWLCSVFRLTLLCSLARNWVHLQGLDPLLPKSSQSTPALNIKAMRCFGGIECDKI